MRVKLENERQALAAFVSKFDALGLGGLGLPPISVSSTSTSSLQPTQTDSRRRKRDLRRKAKEPSGSGPTGISQDHRNQRTRSEFCDRVAVKVSTKTKMENQPSLLEEEWEGVSMHAEDFEAETMIAAAVPLKERREVRF
jgi:centromeric protein E